MAGEPDLAPGVESEWVLYLQQSLNHHYQQSVVEESGSFDDTTAAAVRHFRGQNGLGDGESVDAAVWAALLGGAQPATPAAHDEAQPEHAAAQDQQAHQTYADPIAGVHDGDPADAGAEGAGGGGSGDEESTSTDRGLTSEEASTADEVFHGTLNTSDIVLSEGGILAVGGYARTLPDHVTFPDGTLTNPPSSFMHWLMHELGHCWQYQQGASVPGLIISALGADYDYGGEQGLRDAAAQGKPFDDFGYEEQAEIFADYYAARQRGDTSAFDPYMDSVRDGTWRQAPAVAAH